MPPHHWFLCSTLLLAPGLHASDGPWRDLFNEKDLEGWVQRGGQAKYTIADRAIVGTTVPDTPNSFLCTEREYSNFRLELDFKVDPELNSGIQIRSHSLPDYREGRVHGYQVELDPSDRGWTGGIYDESRRGWLHTLEHNPAARYAFRPDEWNHLRIEALGDSIRTWLNGVPAADLRDSLTKSGFIALQVHGVGERKDPLQVRWKNIRLQELEPGTRDRPAPSATANPARLVPPVVPPGATVKKVADGFRFTEGPAMSTSGLLYFSDIPNERIHTFDTRSGAVARFREDSGKANGLMLTPAGALIACEGGNRVLARYAAGGRTELASHFKGKRLNSPNDLDLDGKGGIYFTDPRYGNREDMELEVEGVYYLDRRGQLSRVIDGLVRPNGLVLSRNGDRLFVADNGAKTIWVFQVREDGKVDPGIKFADMDLNGSGGGDGMTLDSRGNVYCAGQGHIWIWSPEGALLHKIAVPEGPANCTFGGPDGKTLYITARTGLYQIRLNVSGG